MARDFVDWVIRGWAEERPDLDASSIAVVGRLLRVANLLERRFERLCREHGFSFWAFTVLTALRRSGTPYRLTPGQLRRDGIVSAAAVTKRVARLEELGLVERLPDPADGRGALVALTPRGLETIDDLSARYLEDERAAIEALDASECATLAGLLKKTLLGLEGPRAGPGRAEREGPAPARAAVPPKASDPRGSLTGAEALYEGGRGVKGDGGVMGLGWG